MTLYNLKTSQYYIFWWHVLIPCLLFWHQRLYMNLKLQHFLCLYTRNKFISEAQFHDNIVRSTRDKYYRYKQTKYNTKIKQWSVTIIVLSDATLCKYSISQCQHNIHEYQIFIATNVLIPIITTLLRLHSNHTKCENTTSCMPCGAKTICNI